ncbi:FAD dependent oxidoreductase [Clavulina sp. PMI_390]|nr:FAD dependent oxidoreductase [Clavulina sp. PMI_390]
MLPSVRPSIARLNPLGRFSYREPEGYVDHLVIGAGIVGLAIARQLAEHFPTLSTFLVERHSHAGQETSSRNSEVIHAGLYYRSDSLKTRLCIRGRVLMYDYCASRGIPHRNVGKLVVASQAQLGKVHTTHGHVEGLRQAAAAGRLAGLTSEMIPTTRILTGDETHQLEPDLSPAIAGALLSPTTGIVDSHALMQSLEADVVSANGNVAYETRVVRIDPHPEGFAVQLQTGGDQATPDAVVARTVVNASGLCAPLILNSLTWPEAPVPMYFARGSYASYYSKKGAEQVSHLVYPVPEDKGGHSFASLGTHLTLDMSGNIRFGPDIEWVSAPEHMAENEEGQWWVKYYEPRVLEKDTRGVMHDAISRYLDRIDPEGLREDYVGMRPKLVGPGGGFQDFDVRVHSAAQFRGGGKGQMISLMGIESPGLTSSLALGEYVGGLVRGSI